MRFFWLALLSVFLSVATYAQNITISGKVTTSVSHTGLGKVSVFLNNSSYGTETADDGTFKLYNVKPGQYDLVATSVGFQDFSKTILVGNEPINIDIPLQPKVTELRGVVISSNADWKKNYEEFKNVFIGTSKNAKSCVVVNPHSVNLINHSRARRLEAWTNEFLIVENHSLGYRVKFLVDSFSNDQLADLLYNRGHAVFEELPGSAEQKRIWKEKRRETYYGSMQHFLHALYNNAIDRDGFIVYRFTRTLNPERPQEQLIVQKMKKFQELRNRDSLIYWDSKERLSRYSNENLIRTPLLPYQICTPASVHGYFVLNIPDHLYVIYTKKHEDQDFRNMFRPLDMENFESSILTSISRYIVFDMNGTVVQGEPLIEGTWSKARLAEMLPYDYTPEDDK